MRKHKRNQEHENHERWLVSYADFMTLLFAFFVVMYATSTGNTEKQKEFEESLKVNLHLLGRGGTDQDPNSIDATIADLNAAVSIFPKKGSSREYTEYVENNLDKSLGEEKKKFVQDIYHDSVGVRIALTGSAMFPEASSKLKLTALKSLDQIANLLKGSENRVIVEGHTDNIPINDKNFNSNWELAGNRSTSVIRYLTKYHNIDSSRFTSISYGDQKPLVPNDTEEHRAMNRRIEIFIVTDQSKVGI